MRALYSRIITVVFLGLAPLALSTCAYKKEVTTTGIKLGKSTLSELKSSLGEPIKTHNVKTNDGDKLQIIDYPKEQKFQIDQNSIVVARYRKPAPHEETLQYWRHAWKGLDQKLNEVQGVRKVDDQPDLELRVPSLGMAVIYSPAFDRVTQVVEYASP